MAADAVYHQKQAAGVPPIDWDMGPRETRRVSSDQSVRGQRMEMWCWRNLWNRKDFFSMCADSDRARKRRIFRKWTPSNRQGQKKTAIDRGENDP